MLLRTIPDPLKKMTWKMADKNLIWGNDLLSESILNVLTSAESDHQRCSLGGGHPGCDILGASWRWLPWQLGCLRLTLVWALRMGKASGGRGEFRLKVVQTPLRCSEQRQRGGGELHGGANTTAMLWAQVVGAGSWAPQWRLPAPSSPPQPSPGHILWCWQ